MIDIEQQEQMLVAIGKIIAKKIFVYAIGGTAMMLRGIKNSTLDVDLVFDKRNDREEFINSLKKLGAKESDVTLVYGLRNNSPLMLKLGDCRFDMFMNKVISSTFSDAMKERARQIHEFGNLIIKVADVNDILIMKSATSRAKDLDDIISIINKNKVDWGVILNELKNQVKLGNENAIMNFGEKIEKLVNQKAVKIPNGVYEEVWRMFRRGVGGRVRGRKKDRHNFAMV